MKQKAGKVLDKLVNAYPNMLDNPSRHNPFHTLIGCILSQRTKDNNSEKATEALFSHVSTPSDIIKLNQEELHDLIRCSGFYRQKSKYIKETCRELIERHDGVVPNSRNELLRLTGVGPKTADIVMSHCFNDLVIPVDVHVSRVSRRLGLASMEANPEGVQSSLHKLIPRSRYLFYDRSIVQVGKDYCKKSNPLCNECPLKDCCDYSKTSRGI